MKKGVVVVVVNERVRTRKSEQRVNELRLNTFKVAHKISG